MENTVSDDMATYSMTSLSDVLMTSLLLKDTKCLQKQLSTNKATVFHSVQLVLLEPRVPTFVAAILKQATKKT